MLTRGEVIGSHGGARNNGLRVSDRLSYHDCVKLTKAAHIAESLDEPFNCWTTILWEKSGVDSRLNRQFTSAYIKLVSSWVRGKGYRLKWIWVQENGSINGAHVHLLMHIPPNLYEFFHYWPTRWVKQLIANQASHSVYLPKTQRTDITSNYAAKLAYMMKATDAVTARKFNLCRYGEFSDVFGKRAGTWQFQNYCKAT